MAPPASEVSPFVDSLWRLTCDIPFEVGSWDEHGEKFVVKQQSEFQNLVSRYFTCNWKTFVRQLHFYGFSKTDKRSITWSLSHPNFRQGRPDLLCGVKRKTLGKAKPVAPTCGAKDVKEVDQLRAELVTYKKNTEAVLREVKEEMVAELQAVKREISIIKHSVLHLNQHQEEDQPLKRRRRWESASSSSSSTRITEVTETEEGTIEVDFLGSLDLLGIDGLLQQFGEDMVVPRRLDPDIDTTMPEMWIVMNKKVNVGARFFASFLNSFVASARAWYETQSEPVLSKAIPQDYPLQKLQRLLNPRTSQILSSSLSADELAHELIIRMGMPEQNASGAQGLSVFEYILDGEVRQLRAHDFATFLSDIVKGVKMLVNNEVTTIHGQSCPLFDRVQPLLAPFTQKAVLLSQQLYRTALVDRSTAYRLWNCKCNGAHTQPRN